MKYILFIFFPYLYLFFLCGINPPKDERSCFYLDLDPEVNTLNKSCCMLFNNINNKKFCYMVTEEEINNKSKKYNNEIYEIQCKNESQNNIDNKTYEPYFGEICVEESINITSPKICIENNIYDKIKYPCCLFRFQYENSNEKKNICISLGYIGSKDYLTYDKSILDCHINYIKNKFLLIIILIFIIYMT